MTTVSSIITSAGYDLKLSTADASTRENELISYINRCITTIIMPLLIRFKSDMGMKEWTTTESTAYLPKYSLPTDFKSFYALYAKTYTHAGTLASAASSSSLTLDSEAEDSDDYYNGMMIRLTSGTYADAENYILDYDGDTVTATTSAFSGAPSTDTFVIFEPFTEDDELTQVEIDEYRRDYTGTADCPEVYSLLTDSYLLVGPCPNSAEVVFYALYFYLPTALTATTDSLPFNGVFDEIVRSYVTQMALLRDEYDIRVENSLHARMEEDVVSIIKERSRKRPGGGQSKIVGSRDY